VPPNWTYHLTLRPPPRRPVRLAITPPFSRSVTCIIAAPLGIIIVRGQGNYPENTDIASIKWQDKFSDVHVYLSNKGNYDYTNINVTIQTDLLIWQIGAAGPFTQCKSSPIDNLHIMSLMLDVLGSTGKNFTLISKPPTASKKFKIHCDALLSQTDVEFVLALVNLNSASGKSLAPGAPMLLPRVEPKWAAVRVDFEANGRSLERDASKCFDGEKGCPDMLQDDGKEHVVGVINIP